MPRILQIAQLGHPVLRVPAAPVGAVADVPVQALIDDMLATLEDVGGLGLAAPQVYEGQRIFVISSRPGPAYPKALELAPIAMINPEILARSTEIDHGWEGCLSIPGLRGLVPRAHRIQVRYLTSTGAEETRTLEDLAARVFQHELDHLDGVVYLDRLESVRDLMSEREYQRMVR